MSFPNAPKRGKSGARPDHFAYYPLDKGKDVYGYLAGPVLWLEMHCSDLGSKPCLDKLTGGELSCPWCVYGEPKQKGACPWWHSDDHTPHMVWLDDGRRDVYDDFKWARRLKFSRDRVDGAPVWAMVCLGQEPRFKSDHPHRQGPQDITRSLLRMFKTPALDLWYATTHGRSDNAMSLEPEAPVEPPVKGRKVTEWNRFVELGSIGRMEGTVAEGTAPSSEEEYRKHGHRDGPSSNGKHKPTG